MQLLDFFFFFFVHVWNVWPLCCLGYFLMIQMLLWNLVFPLFSALYLPLPRPSLCHLFFLFLCACTLFCVIIPTYYFCPEPSLVMSLSAASCRHTLACTHTHVHTYICTQPQRFSCTCTGMEVIKARSKVCLITRLQWKLLVCFMHWYQKAGGGKWKRKRGKRGG